VTLAVTRPRVCISCGAAGLVRVDETGRGPEREQSAQQRLPSPSSTEETSFAPNCVTDDYRPFAPPCPTSGRARRFTGMLVGSST
jgi:hypothetical protein